MFIELKSGAMLNLFWLSDCFQGKHDLNIVIFYMVNGVKLIEEYATDSEAFLRVQEVKEAMLNAGGGGPSGTVKSVNGKTGHVILTASDIKTTSGKTIQQVLDELAEDFDKKANKMDIFGYHIELNEEGTNYVKDDIIELHYRNGTDFFDAIIKVDTVDSSGRVANFTVLYQFANKGGLTGPIPAEFGNGSGCDFNLYQNTTGTYDMVDVYLKLQDMIGVDSGLDWSEY